MNDRGAPASRLSSLAAMQTLGIILTEKLSELLGAVISEIIVGTRHFRAPA